MTESNIHLQRKHKSDLFMVPVNKGNITQVGESDTVALQRLLRKETYEQKQYVTKKQTNMGVL